MPSINAWGRENPDRVDVPDDAPVVPPEDAQQYGYWGVSINNDRYSHTVAGVTEGTSSPSDPGKSASTDSKTDTAPKADAGPKHAEPASTTTTTTTTSKEASS